MEEFLRKIVEEVVISSNDYLTEQEDNEDEGGAEETGLPPEIANIVTKLVYKEPFVARMLSRSYTRYFKDSSISTAGVRPWRGKIEFYYNPQFLAQLSEPEVVFLIAHELFHIIRSHNIRGSGAGATTNRLHYLMNVAQDSMINGEIQKRGKGPGGLPMKVIEGAWFLKKGDEPSGGKYGIIEEEWQRDKKDDYKGSKVSEPIYKWMKERDLEAQQKNKKQQQQQSQQSQQGQQGQQGQQQGQPQWEAAVGEPVYNEKSNEYGIVTDVQGKKVTVTKVTEQEALDAAKKLFGFRSTKYQSFKKKINTAKRRNSPKDIEKAIDDLMA
jgi:hypothetical protein